jgi:uncharacterized protein (DUF58 family)
VKDAATGPPALDAAAVLRRLELTIVRRLEGFLRGEHLGLLPGPGTDLAEARVYQPGEDDVRHMDWAVTARTTVPHVHDLVADRELETWALVDLSASMNFGTAAMEKRDLAVAAVATTGVLTQRLGDRFGGYVLSGRGLRRFPARSGRLALHALVRALLEEPRAADAVDAADTTDTVDAAPPLEDALLTLAAAHPRRGLRVVVSDFLGPAERWQRPLSRVALRHQVLAVEVLDPRELSLPDVGVVALADPETGVVREVDTGRRRTRQAFAAAAAAHREQVRATLRRAGAAHLVLRTDADWVADTARFVLAHRRSARHVHRARRGVP